MSCTSIDFPDFPVSGQIFSAASKIWSWDTVSWNIEGCIKEEEANNWVRNPSWLTLPVLSVSDQRVVGLFAVTNDDSNYLAFSCAGNYTVDWGDGNIENFSSGVTAQHLYSYSSVSQSTEFELSTGIIARQVIISITPQAGANMTSFDFQKKHSSTFSAYNSNWLDISINSPFLTSLILSISAIFGTSIQITGMNWVEQVNIGVIGTVRICRFRDFIKLSNVIINETISFNSTSYMFYNCQSLKLVPLFDTSSVNNMEKMFENCYSLKTVPLFNTGSVTNMSYMFNGCRSLLSVPLLNTVAATNMEGIFYFCENLKSIPLLNTLNVFYFISAFSGCASLKSVPLFNTVAATDMSYMFSNCYSLKSVPLFNTISVTNMKFMFSNCVSLETIPLFNTISVTNMASMFEYCYSLETVPLFNTISVTDMNFMFFDCGILKSVPLFNTFIVDDMSYMFGYCYSLQSVPLFNLQNLLNMEGMFYYCLSLKSIPFFNTSYVAYMSYTFSDCRSLISIPPLVTSNINNFGEMTSTFESASSLASAPLSGTRISHSFTECKLSRAAIVAIFNNLGTASRTINVSLNYGTSSLTASDRLIATSKGWTIVT